jgi:hypothetical protein
MLWQQFANFIATRRRCESSIKVDVKEIAYVFGSSTDRDQWLAVVKTVMNHRLHQKPGNFLAR